MSTKEKAEVIIPENVRIHKEGHIIVVTGNKGTIRKDLHKIPAKINVTERSVTIEPAGRRKSDLAVTNTAKSIITNMFKGVEKGFVYKLKIVFAHFPISVKVKGREIHVENFFGERSARVSHVVGDTTKVNVVAEDVVVEGPSLEDVSQTAANIESSTKVKGKDQRVFLDGLYIYSRNEGE
ncbi:MAG: 50S ribosomal protein L6 [Thermoproteota archaeon]|jgi:large subunit ribosomal protein L6|nr:50S ribosomal protein L6 [Thermoproteota archaeon]